MIHEEYYFIAEIGSNWKQYDDSNANYKELERQIHIAKTCGADAVKFQMYTAEELYGPEVTPEIKANVDQWALPREWIGKIKNYCDICHIDFMCSAFSIEGFKFLDPLVRFHKIASSEAYAPFINKVLRVITKPVLVSDGVFSIAGFSDKRKIIPMRCVANYPAEIKDYSFHQLPDMWGLSDHTLTDDLAVLASSLKCKFFEKHVDFSRERNRTPDKAVSVGAEQYKRYIEAVKNPDFVNIRRENRLKYGRMDFNGSLYRPMPQG